MSRFFHIDTVPHALPRFHNPFSSVLVQFEKATVQPRTLCRLSSSWTHQGLQWKCFRKLAQRNRWVLAISVGVLSLLPGSYILKRMIIITTSFGDWWFKAVFWLGDLSCNHPLKRCRSWPKRPWISKTSSRSTTCFIRCDSCSGGVVLFCSKFQKSEDRQMAPSVESCWS